MGRLCLVLTIVSLLWGYCSAQTCRSPSCCTWTAPPYQNATNLTLGDTTTTPLGFRNTVLPSREISTVEPTICVDVNVPNPTSSNYVFVAVESNGGSVCIYFEDTSMEACASGSVFLCNQLAGSSVRISFYCERGTSCNTDTFFYYKMETIALDRNDEDAWCVRRNREVPSFLAAGTANENIDVTLGDDDDMDSSALGLGTTLLLLPLLLMGVLFQP